MTKGLVTNGGICRLKWQERLRKGNRRRRPWILINVPIRELNQQRP